MADFQEKLAQVRQQPFWQRALTAQVNKPHWDTGKSFLHNLGANAAQARLRGQEMIAGQRQALDLQAALQPGFAMQRMRHFLRHGDPVVRNPVDQLLLEGPHAGL